MRSVVAVISAFFAVTLTAAAEQWPQWAGPQRNFAADVRASDSWPATGPPVVWRRDLGNGHSGIVTTAGRIFTAHGSGKRETVVALDRASGRTVWERSFDVGYAAHREDWDGPHATPIVVGTPVGDRLITVAIDATVRAWSVDDGKLLWKRDLRADHSVALPQSGYAASPLAWRDTILLPGLGGKAPGALALRIDDGSTAWARHAFRSSHASPILVRFAGREHAVFHGMDELVGLDPSSGDRIWRYALRSGAADNVSFTPVWDPTRRQILLSHGYDDAGMRAIRLLDTEGSIDTEQVWTNRRLRVDHGNVVLFDGLVLGSNRSDPGVLVALDAATGSLLWRRRMPKITALRVGDKVLLLDEDGRLHLARPDREGLNVLAGANVLKNNAWTLPSVAGGTVFLRDRFEAVALQLPLAAPR